MGTLGKADELVDVWKGFVRARGVPFDEWDEFDGLGALDADRDAEPAE